MEKRNNGWLRMSRWNKTLFCIVFLVGILTVVTYVQKKETIHASGENIHAGEQRFCVVLDAGHGGEDPGKVGINSAREKDVNLEIVKRIEEYLTENDVKVVMTREKDEALHSGASDQKKVRDMKKRVQVIEETAPDVTVSIHQNSYPQEEIHGAQVFFYQGSDEGEKLARLIQESIKERVDENNKREVKANATYYLLKKTSTPIVIVECGFLSNREEAEKLCTEDYQKEMAWAISMGILQYLNNSD